jgi:hypothetical protein
VLEVLQGNPVSFLTQSNGKAVAVLLALVIVFVVPGGVGASIVAYKPTRFIWQSVGALNVAYSVEAAIAVAPKFGGGLVTTLTLCVLSATGGAILAEFGNLLLLSPEAYKSPNNAPNANALLACFAGLAYLALNKSLGLPAAVSGAIPAWASTNAAALVATALVLVGVGMTPQDVQARVAKLYASVGLGALAMVESPLPGDDEDGELPWPLCDGLWGYNVTSDDFDGDALPSLFWEDDEEEEDDDEDEAEAAAPAPAPAPAPKASSAKKAAKPAAKAASPKPAAGRRTRAGSSK